VKRVEQSTCLCELIEKCELHSHRIRQRHRSRLPAVIGIRVGTLLLRSSLEELRLVDFQHLPDDGFPVR
jgi:hypothetical protein